MNPWRRNVATLMVGLQKKNKNGHIRKNLTKNGEPQEQNYQPEMCHVRFITSFSLDQFQFK